MVNLFLGKITPPSPPMACARSGCGGADVVIQAILKETFFLLVGKILISPRRRVENGKQNHDFWFREKFWSWLRRELLRRDLQDLKDKRPVLKKPAYLKRVQAVCRSARAQEVAANCALNFRKACQQVSDAGGASAGG